MAFQLERLRSDLAIVDQEGRPTPAFQRWWQATLEAIEKQELAQDAVLAKLNEQQTALAAQLALIQAAQTAANAAQTAATAAQTSANKVTTANAISASYTAPSMVLSAADAGTNATITVAGFVRHYDDGTQVNVAGGALTGQPYGTVLSVYYDDPSRTNTKPVMVATANDAEARHNFAPGRHFVGTVTTPAAGAPPTSGGSTPPGGGVLAPNPY